MSIYPFALSHVARNSRELSIFEQHYSVSALKNQGLPPASEKRWLLSNAILAWSFCRYMFWHWFLMSFAHPHLRNPFRSAFWCYFPMFFRPESNQWHEISMAKRVYVYRLWTKMAPNREPKILFSWVHISAAIRHSTPKCALSAPKLVLSRRSLSVSTLRSSLSGYMYDMIYGYVYIYDIYIYTIYMCRTFRTSNMSIRQRACWPTANTSAFCRTRTCQSSASAAQAASSQPAAATID